MTPWASSPAVRWIVVNVRRWRSGILSHALTQASDRDIDAELAKCALRRSDLFTLRGAVARHRKRMAYMLESWRIGVPRATEEHWRSMKNADRRCSLCPCAERCRQWFEWGRPRTIPLTFCPNARLFSALAAEQAAGTRSRPRTYQLNARRGGLIHKT